MCESLIVPIDNLFEQGQFIFDLKKLVNLLLILNDSKFGLRIFSNEFYLLGNCIRINPY